MTLFIQWKVIKHDATRYLHSTPTGLRATLWQSICLAWGGQDSSPKPQNKAKASTREIELAFMLSWGPVTTSARSYWLSKWWETWGQVTPVAPKWQWTTTCHMDNNKGSASNHEAGYQLVFQFIYSLKQEDSKITLFSNVLWLHCSIQFVFLKKIYLLCVQVCVYTHKHTEWM